MHYLEEVHCLFFVAALSDYDQYLIQDDTSVWFFAKTPVLTNTQSNPTLELHVRNNNVVRSIDA